MLISNLILVSFRTLIILLLLPNIAISAGSDHKEYKQKEWSFDGMTGTFDKQSIQRGYQVYREVCSACHSMKRVYFRNLLDVGFSVEEIKNLASSYDITDGPNSDGDYFERPGIISDKFPSPYPNEEAARASNNGAYPPDLSLIYKARMDGANYLFSLLTGFSEIKPYGLEVPEGMHYNPYFSGYKIAMAAPLSEGIVEYSDGTPATVEQMSIDVVNFLQWASEPEMEQRKKIGHSVLIYLIIFTVIFYIAKKIIWRDIK